MSRQATNPTRALVAVLVALASVLTWPGTAAPAPQAVAGAARVGSPVHALGEQPIIRNEEGQVIRLYQAVLGRSPDAEGFAFWYRRLTSYESLARLADHFMASPEFASIAAAPTDAEFVTLMYRHVLDRAPDPGGRAFWLTQLGAGMSRNQVVLHFSESREFIAKTGTAIGALPAFESEVSTVTAAELGSSWRAGCPVGPSELRLVTVSHVGFDGTAKAGQLIVHHTMAANIVSVFAQLYAMRYPIERMELVSDYGSDDIASMEANNTSAFNCRLITGGTRWSNHAYGLAIDVNPLYNPYVSGSTVLPEIGSTWADRSLHHPAVIQPGSDVLAVWANAGWGWGGNYRTIKDWQHFEAR